MKTWILPLFVIALTSLTFAEEPAAGSVAKTETAKLAKATFGGGCFWCTEGVFEKLDAVQDAVAGYTGGQTKDPTYEQICRGNTGHAEVVQLLYDPSKITFDELLDLHFKSHDPTTLNRQGNDVGTQYRSVIFYHDEAQKKAAEKSIEKWNKSGTFKDPIVTEVKPIAEFYEAETYHQDFYKKNPGHAYLRFSLDPKMKKLRSTFENMNEKK